LAYVWCSLTASRFPGYLQGTKSPASEPKGVAAEESDHEFMDELGYLDDEDEGEEFRLCRSPGSVGCSVPVLRHKDCT